MDEKELNDSLRHQLDESRAQHEEDADASIQLKDAQEDIDLLRRKLADAQQRAEVKVTHQGSWVTVQLSCDRWSRQHYARS